MGLMTAQHGKLGSQFGGTTREGVSLLCLPRVSSMYCSLQGVAVPVQYCAAECNVVC